MKCRICPSTDSVVFRTCQLVVSSSLNKPITELYSRQILSTDFMNKFYLVVKKNVKTFDFDHRLDNNNNNNSVCACVFFPLQRQKNTVALLCTITVLYRSYFVSRIPVYVCYYSYVGCMLVLSYTRKRTGFCSVKDQKYTPARH